MNSWGGARACLRARTTFLSWFSIPLACAQVRAPRWRVGYSFQAGYVGTGPPEHLLCRHTDGFPFVSLAGRDPLVRSVCQSGVPFQRARCGRLQLRCVPAGAHSTPRGRADMLLVSRGPDGEHRLFMAPAVARRGVLLRDRRGGSAAVRTQGTRALEPSSALLVSQCSRARPPPRASPRAWPPLSTQVCCSCTSFVAAKFTTKGHRMRRETMCGFIEPDRVRGLTLLGGR